MLCARDPRLRRHHTTRSLDTDAPIATLNTPFNGTIIGIVTEDINLPKTDEDSPLLRKCSLYNKSKKKVHDANYIQFCKKWRSLENVADKDVRKMPRLAIRSWLLGIFNGTRSSTSSLRKAPPLLDRESAV